LLVDFLPPNFLGGGLLTAPPSRPNSSITDLASAGSGSGSAKLALHTGEDPPSVSGLGREPEPNGGGEFWILDPPQLKGLKLSSSWSGSNLYIAVGTGSSSSSSVWASWFSGAFTFRGGGLGLLVLVF